MPIHIKRVYEAPAKSDGYRVLVDRLWPRGLRKDEAIVDVWLKEIAPSAELRRWFGHAPEKWSEFRRRYFHELAAHDTEIEELRLRARSGTLTLLFAAKDEANNNAAALKDYLEKR